jgi:peroxiredoxin
MIKLVHLLVKLVVLDFLTQFPEMRVVPQTFIFNSQGQLSAHIVGIKPRSHFKKLIDELL